MQNTLSLDKDLTTGPPRGNQMKYTQCVASRRKYRNRFMHEIFILFSIHICRIKRNRFVDCEW